MGQVQMLPPQSKHHACRARLDSHYRHAGSTAKGNPFAEAPMGMRRSADASLPSGPEEAPSSYRERLAQYRHA